MGRNKLHQQDASGDIVVVAIDDKSLAAAGGSPWRRRDYAQLIDSLRSMGAARIAVDADLSSAGTPADDAALAAALARAQGRVVLAARFLIDPVTGERSDLLPAATFRRHATIANANSRYNYSNIVWELPYAMTMAGRSYRSLAAELAGVTGDSGATFPIDYSIRPESIPVVRAIDLIEGRVPAARVAGKAVIVGTTSAKLGETFFIPGRAKAPRTYLYVLGAETLKSGHPVRLGWLLPLLATIGLGIGYGQLRNRILARTALAAGGVMLLGIPLLAEHRMIFIDTMPSLAFVAILASMSAGAAYRQSYRERGTTNPVSGLPNLNALREHESGAVATLVAARIHNYAAITAALPQDSERTLVHAIAKRLAMGGGAAVHQGDEGIFVWTTEAGGTLLGDQLEALHALCRAPISVDGTTVDLVVSFGVDSDGARSVVNRIGSALVAADEAMKEGRRWKAFDAARLEDAAWKLSLLGRLDAAIDGGEIWVAYQPKLDLTTKAITGAEALVRWTHPEKGEIGPVEFIPAAEEHNRIEKLTSYVLASAIRTAADINARGIPFRIAVNLSARLLDSSDLVDGVAALLAKHRLRARDLTLEVTESSAVDGNARSLATLHALRALGVAISIDDYGTGFSTLDYLKRIPATEIKIDRSFVGAIDRSQSDKLMVNSTIQLAHSLGRTVVAEGVETAEILRALEAMNCDEAQGYFIGKPMRLADLLKVLSRELRREVA